MTRAAFRILYMVGIFCLAGRPGHAQQRPACHQFYERERFLQVAIGGKPVLSVWNLNGYSFRVTYQEGYRRTLTVTIYKTRTGENLMRYLQPGDLIKKVNGNYSVIVARQVSGGMDVQQFDVGCGG